MKKVSAEDVRYEYKKNGVTREQLISALRACSNPVERCTNCIYSQMHTSSCIMHLMDDTADFLEDEANGKQR